MGPLRPPRLAPGVHVEPDTGHVLFVVDRDDSGTRPVSVWFHLREFGADTRFRSAGGQWVARIPHPPVARMEYLIVMRDQHGNESMVLDPGNPRRADGVFGEHSLIEFPDYRRPAWLDHRVPAGTATTVRWELPAEGLSVGGVLWSPDGAATSDPLPLLVVHDGPEYAELALLLRHVAWLTDPRVVGEAGRAHPRTRFRVLLLHPEDRNRIYSASPAYSRALMDHALPDLTHQVATRGPLIGLGASLGALALVHAHVHRPGVFGGLLLQSGSFFRAMYDSQEARFPFYGRIVRFVDELTIQPEVLVGAALSFTCGTGEENLTNNTALVRRLRRAGVRVAFTENSDGHNYTGWRDCLHPALADLLDAVWT